MASIQLTNNDNGTAYTVNYYQPGTTNGRHNDFTSIDEATAFFYDCEDMAISRRTADNADYCASWSLQKLVWFYLGYCNHQMEANRLTYSSYLKRKYILLAIDSELLLKQLREISRYDLKVSVKPAGLKLLRSAFHQLLKREAFFFNPAPKTKVGRKKPLDMPSKSTVKKMLEEPGVRERIVFWLGAICGLRIGEILALKGSDISRTEILVNKRMTRGGVINPGTKSGQQRRIKMPKKLYELFQEYDPQLIGSNQPVIKSVYTGRHIGTDYSTQGVMKRLLNHYGVESFHNLRHFAVSRLAGNGTDMIRVSKMIGHSRPSTTTDVYSHLFGELPDLDFD